jgi:hypothetical protein
MDNHLDRPELLAAKEKGHGSSWRYSKTLKADLVYVAVSYKTDRGSGFIRVSKTSGELDRALMEERLLMTGLGVFIFFITLIIAMMTNIHLSRRINMGHDYLEEKIRERTNHIYILNQLSTMLTACDSSEEAFTIVGKIGQKLLPQFFGALSLYRLRVTPGGGRHLERGMEGGPFFSPQ